MKEKIQELFDQAKKTDRALNDLVKGEQVRILSDWNGQLHGRSRKSMKGKTFEVAHATIDPYWGVYLFLEGERVSIMAKEVEFL